MIVTALETWFPACRTTDVPSNGGVCVKIGEQQIALFHLAQNNQWFATDNQCPHRGQMALSRGMLGSRSGEPKIACPFHKKTFSLETGKCFEEDELKVKTYQVKIEDDRVYINVSTD
jgi:nitrite reductase (NADH) small subunit